MDLIYWSVRSSRGNGKKWVDREGGIFISAIWEYYFMRAHENLGQNPSNYISIFPYLSILICQCTFRTSRQMSHNQIGCLSCNL